uniref:EF-hand domain-containing protein n=1 Tax=Plectus sambesii TaxID=2011161 RepID=A0A914VDJ4_9BILA
MTFTLVPQYSGGTYFYLREVNDDGTLVNDQNGIPLTQGPKEYYNNADTGTVLNTSSSNPLRLQYVEGMETCALILPYSSKVLSAELYDYDDSGPVAKLIQDYGSSMVQQWSFELTTDIDAQFNRLDQNNDGELTLEECVNVKDPLILQNNDVISYRLKTFINYDNNSDGYVTRDEEDAYGNKYRDETKDMRLKNLREFIKDFDENNDTMLQSDEMKLLLASTERVVTKDSFATTFMKYDKNGDKGLDVYEMDDLGGNFVDVIRDFIPLEVTKSFDKSSTIHY